MNRVVVFGGTGAGKSTLARAMGERLGIAVCHLDAIYYAPGWQDPAPEAFRARIAEAVAGERWISEGNFIRLTADLKLPRADAVVWIEQPRWRRMWRAVRRGWRDRERDRPDLAPGCRDHVDATLLRDVLKFDREYRPMIEDALARHAPAALVIRLRGDRAVRAFLDTLEPEMLSSPS